MIPNAIKNTPPLFLLHLQTGEELRAWLLKNDLLTEKVFVAGNRLIFECEAKHSELYFKNRMIYKPYKL